MHLELLVGNICQNPVMPIEKVREDLLKAKNSKAKIICLNEIGKREYKDCAAQVFSYLTGYHESFLKNTADPIFLDKEVGRFSATRSIELVDGERKITPDRDLNVGKIKLFALHEDIVVINTHWPNGAFGIKHLFTKKRRKKLWRKCLIRTETEISYWLGRGCTVIIVGDFNKKNMPNLSAKFKWVAGKEGIVKVGVAHPAEPKVKVQFVDETVIRNVNTDKPLRKVEFKVFKVRKP